MHIVVTVLDFILFNLPPCQHSIKKLIYLLFFVGMFLLVLLIKVSIWTLFDSLKKNNFVFRYFQTETAALSTKRLTIKCPLPMSLNFKCLDHVNASAVWIVGLNVSGMVDTKIFCITTSGVRSIKCLDLVCPRWCDVSWRRIEFSAKSQQKASFLISTCDILLHFDIVL